MKNQQVAFGGTEKMLKGALHCHTTRSDGEGTPEAVTRLYADKGFDFIAITDHDRYNYAHYAPDTGITILPGMEREHRLSTEGVHCYHAVCLGPLEADGNGFAQDERFEGNALVSGPSAYQAVLDTIHARNNLTIHCHPEWSGASAREFIDLTGHFAMEIWNTGCVMEYDLDMNAPFWDEVLLTGKRISGVAVDDGHPMYQHGHGWVRVRAENTVASILDALKEGAFYSSCGPEIYDFYIEDGKATLVCSPVRSIGFRNGRLPTQIQRGDDITRAEFVIPPYFSYVRAVVQDVQGRRAWTNPIYL